MVESLVGLPWLRYILFAMHQHLLGQLSAGIGSRNVEGATNLDLFIDPYLPCSSNI